MIREIRYCDLCADESKDTLAEKTSSMTWDGNEYEIDTCSRHTIALDKVMAPYVEHGRNITRQVRAVRAVSDAPGPKRNRSRPKQIRTWAKERGYAVNDHGRIPVEIQTEYDRVHALLPKRQQTLAG